MNSLAGISIALCLLMFSAAGVYIHRIRTVGYQEFWLTYHPTLTWKEFWWFCASLYIMFIASGVLLCAGTAWLVIYSPVLKNLFHG